MALFNELSFDSEHTWGRGYYISEPYPDAEFARQHLEDEVYSFIPKKFRDQVRFLTKNMDELHINKNNPIREFGWIGWIYKPKKGENMAKLYKCDNCPNTFTRDSTKPQIIDGAAEFTVWIGRRKLTVKIEIKNDQFHSVGEISELCEQCILKHFFKLMPANMPLAPKSDECPI